MADYIFYVRFGVTGLQNSWGPALIWCILYHSWRREPSALSQNGYNINHLVGISKMHELLNLRALKISTLHKNRIFQCMGMIFCVEFQSYPLKFHTKYLTIYQKMCILYAVENIRALRFKAHTCFWNAPWQHHTEAWITTATQRCHKPLANGRAASFWKLLCHWLKGLWQQILHSSTRRAIPFF